MENLSKAKVEYSTAENDMPRVSGIWRIFLYSAIGAFVFFWPVTYKGNSSILLDHIVTFVREQAPVGAQWFVLGLCAFGTIRAFVNGDYKLGGIKTFFAFANVIGFIVSALMVLGKLPGVLGEKDLVPFLWEKIAMSVGLIIPIGSIFLALLIGYGLLEFVGVLMQPIMRPLWKAPGRSAIDAVASFVGSYSLGILITDRVYQSGGYTAREAAIICTGFSTVSAAFMVIVAKSLDLMEIWGLYFAVALIVTFIVTAITVRIYPLSKIPDECFEGVEPDPEKPIHNNRFKAAKREALLTLAGAPSLQENLWINLRDGVRLASSVVPSIMSVGLAGLLIARFTPVFEWVGYLFYPFAWVVNLPEPVRAGEAMAMGIAEMFLPATQIGSEADLVLRFVIGVVAVSAIIFFSGLVPCIFATKIPIKISHLLIIWFERVALTVLITTPIAHLLL